ncbi:hypothetical protein [Microbulbifer sp. JSM ZJ756]|uniref:hypothetical protein n=1 Tax=Microbulbifer sp. JSM ZJ756 TaxID=3376191 RepID=UPI0037AB8D63
MGHLSLLLATAMLFPGDAHNTIDGYAPVSANPAYSDTTGHTNTKLPTAMTQASTASCGCHRKTQNPAGR